jgi:Fe-S oxidoreductase
MSLDELREDAEGCVRCSNCKWVDPAYMKNKRYSKICPISARYLFDAYSGQGLLDISLGIMDGKLDYSPGLLDPVYKCTSCGACDTMCKRSLDLDVLEVIYRTRAKIVDAGKGPLPEQKKLALRVKETHNIYGEPHETRNHWMSSTESASLSQQNPKLVYFVGCASSYRNKEIARSTVKILNRAGIEFATIDEWCTGASLYRVGLVAQTKELMNHNLKALDEAGAETLLVSCAECYYMFKVIYPKLLGKDDIGVKVVHTSELISELLKENKLRFGKQVKIEVTYHDPCHLGRLGEPYVHWKGKIVENGKHDPPKDFRRGTNGQYEKPREVLKSVPGVDFQEMPRNKENAWCSGGGPEMEVSSHDFTIWTGTERLQEASSLGTRSIVTCCPFAKDNLLEASKLQERKTPVYDLVEIVADSLE